MAERTRVAIVAACFALAACGSGTSSAPAGRPSGSLAATPPAVGASDPAASTRADIVVGGDRPVTVHVPPTYDPSHPAPLLIGLHGYSGSGAQYEAYLHLSEVARERGYLSAFPDGTTNRSDLRFWNATDACCDFDRSGVDDVGYLAGVIREIQAKLAVDPKRIDVIGHSNGGFMAYAMACTHADTIAAIVSLAGAMSASPATCVPTAPVAVLQIHGTADDVIAFDGGTIQTHQIPGMSSAATQPYPGAEASAADWAAYDGCSSKQVLDQRLDIDAHLEDAGLPDETSVTRWTGCRPGGAVELWTIKDGVHSPSLSASFPQDVIDFFDAHPKP